MGRIGRLLANQAAHKGSLESRGTGQLGHDGIVVVQCPGEHMGGGDPPSASEAVDIANIRIMVRTNKRAIIFMRFLLGAWCYRPY